MERLAGKRAVITGAAQGIGRAAAIAFAAEGATVHATDIAPHVADLRGGSVFPDLLDVTDRAAIETFAEKTGPVDILLNCAGYVHEGTILQCDEESWTRSFDINVTSMYRMTKAFLPGMLERGRGSVVNIASVASSIKGFAGRFAYGASKGAVIGLTKSIAADFVGTGIRCNAICPGTVNSPSLEERINRTADPVAARKAFVARQPMGRVGEPTEIAALAVFLASDESAYATGAVHIMDGGITA